MTRTRGKRELMAIHAKGDKKRLAPRKVSASRARSARPGHIIGEYQLRSIVGKNGQVLFFYAKHSKKGKPADMPPGREALRSKSGLPYLAKKSRKQDRALVKLAEKSK